LDWTKSLPEPQPVLFVGSFTALSNLIDASTLSSAFESNKIMVGAFESHLCTVLPVNTTANIIPLVCMGADLLGSVYALYALSEHILGIHPQSFWSERAPIKVTANSFNRPFNKLLSPATAVLVNTIWLLKTTLQVSNIGVADNFTFARDSPVFRHRVYFVNDEDLGFPPDHYDYK
jgi:hypothetical protein